MKEKRDCKLVEDLLPNYIEKLTNKETNDFIEEHLKNCPSCKKIYDNMKEKQEENNVKTKEEENKKVKFFKKYRNKLRVLRIILLVIVLVFVINTGRKVYIINDLNNKAKEYINSENYKKTIYLLDSGKYVKSEGYCLNNKQKIVITTIDENGEKEVVTVYGEKGSNKINTYTEKEGKKTARINEQGEVSIEIGDAFYGLDNKATLIIYAILTNINKTTFNGEECYYVSGPENLGPYKLMYVNKNNGLIISRIAFETEFVNSEKGRVPSTEYKFEFNNVTEEDFIEPDISEYEIIE